MRCMVLRWMMIGFVIAAITPGMFAAPAEEAAPQPAASSAVSGPGFPIGKALAIVGACLGAAGAVVGGSLGIGQIGGKCLEAIARQPEAAGSMFAPMIVTAAMIEGGMLFAVVVCFLGVLYI